MSLLLDALKEADSRHRDHPESRTSRTGEVPAVVDGTVALSILEDSNHAQEQATAAPTPAPAAIDERVARRAELRSTASPPRRIGRRHLLPGLLLLTVVLLGGAYLWMVKLNPSLETLSSGETLREPLPSAPAPVAQPAAEPVIPLQLNIARPAPARTAEAAQHTGPPPEPRPQQPEQQVARSAIQSPMIVERSNTALQPSVLQQAYEALHSGDLSSAETLYAQVLRGEPQQTDALLGLATLAQARGDKAAALAYYKRVLELEPEHPQAWSGLANLAGSNRVEAIESRLHSLLATQPDASLHFALGNLLSRQSRWAEAQESYFNAFAAAPDNPDYAFNLAVALDHLGKQDAAAAHYERALKLIGRGAPAQFDSSAASKRLAALRETSP